MKSAANCDNKKMEQTDKNLHAAVPASLLREAEIAASADSISVDQLITDAVERRLWERRSHVIHPDQVLARYHELVDKRFEKELDPGELVELNEVEDRLNADDESELQQVRSIKRQWTREKTNLVRSISELLARLATP